MNDRFKLTNSGLDIDVENSFSSDTIYLCASSTLGNPLKNFNSVKITALVCGFEQI